ncbi:hypothetical protein [Flammeovirga aprica]|uniref:Lipoprotein n=1 Tax=Flammeovirga aprica JL-4 TaxID=694437 RepID=A0A7X9RZ69_9BACT|nr:hypothetical protein [Flammeovirga aprica]NME71416.1 hypothetical protein [Flammeovirga aprica JL-4]
MKLLYFLSFSLIFLFSCDSDELSYMEKHVKSVRYYLPAEIDNQKSFTVEYNSDFSVKSFDNIDNITYDNGRVISYTEESSNNPTKNISLELDGNKVIKKVEVAGEENEEFILYFDGNEGQPYGKLKVFDSFSVVEIYEWTNNNITKALHYTIPSLDGELSEIPDNIYDFIDNATPTESVSIQYDNYPKTFKFFEGFYEHRSYSFQPFYTESFQTQNNPTLITIRIHSSSFPKVDLEIHYKNTYDENGYISKQETLHRQVWVWEGNNTYKEYDGFTFEFDY